MPAKKKKPPPRKPAAPEKQDGEETSEIRRLMEAVVDHPRCPPEVYHSILDEFEKDPDQLQFEIIDCVHLLESQGYKVTKSGDDDK